MIAYNQPLSPRQFRLLSVKGRKFIGLQRNSRRNMQKVERPCAKLRSSSGRSLRSLAKDFAAERLKFEYSGANVFSKELQRGPDLFFARVLSENSQIERVNDFGLEERCQ